MKPTELAKVDPSTQATAAAAQAQIEAELAAVLGVSINTPEDYAFAAELASDIARRRESFVSMRTTATGPLRQGIRVIESWFLPGVKAYDSALAHLRAVLGNYQTAQRKAELAARNAAALAAAQRDSAAVVSAITTASAARDSLGGTPVGGSAAWDFRVVDPGLVPREFLTVDTAALKAHAKAHAKGTPPPVPGIEFYQTTNVRISKK